MRERNSSMVSKPMKSKLQTSRTENENSFWFPLFWKIQVTPELFHYLSIGGHFDFSGQHLLRKISVLMRHWTMEFLQVTLQFALLALITSSAVFVYVAASKETKENCEDLPRDFVVRSCNRSCSRPCGKNGSNATILFRGNKGEYNVTLVMSNYTTRQTIPLESCELLLKQCVREKQVCEKRGTTRLEVIFKCHDPYCSITRRSKNGLTIARVPSTLRLRCKTKQDKCQWLLTREDYSNCVVLDAGNDANSYNDGSRIKPKVSKEEGSERKVERQTSTTLCLVTLCLLLEILVCVVLYLWLRERHRRSVTLDNENATSNPSYQRGVQLLRVSDSPQIHDNGQETYQPPYQPLVMNTRGPGLTEQYRDLTETRDENHRSNFVVDLASYQDLLQNKTRGGVCRENMIPKEQENLSQDNSTTGKLEENVDKEKEEPIYYVLEEPDPTEENPRRPLQRSNSSPSHREPLYFVIKELRSRNAIDQSNRLISNEENEEPVYHVLENPMEVEEKT